MIRICLLMESHTNEKIRLLYSLQMINNYAQVSSGERELERERERGEREVISRI